MESTACVSAKKRRMNDEHQHYDHATSSSSSGKASVGVRNNKNGTSKKETTKGTVANSKAAQKGKTTSKESKVTKRKMSTTAVGERGSSASLRRSSQEGGGGGGSVCETKKVTNAKKVVVVQKMKVAKKKVTKGLVDRPKSISKKQKVVVTATKKRVAVVKVAVGRGGGGGGRQKNVKGKGAKGFGFWKGPCRLRRMASLNAQAKVHILYEKEARNVVASEEASSPIKSSESHSTSGNADELKKSSTSKITGKVCAGKQKRHLVDDPMTSLYAIAPKRMASLNAQAILAASYSMDRSRTKDKTAKMMASIEAVVAAASVDDDVRLPVQKSDTVMDVINAVASEGLFHDDSDDGKDDEYSSDEEEVFEEPKKKGRRKSGGGGGATTTIPLKLTKIRTNKSKIVKKTKVTSKDNTHVVNPKKRSRSTSKACSDTFATVEEGLLPTTTESLVAALGTELKSLESDRDNPILDCEKDLDLNTKTVSTSPGFIAEDSLPNKVEVKAEAVRRDKIEDTAEVTITGMYVNPVTNTSQSFCISRIHTYKQATSTRSYSPPSLPGNVGPHSAPHLPPPPPPSSHHSRNTTVSSSGGMMHGVHHHGGGLYPYSEHICPADTMGGVPLMDVALSRHYGSAFTVPHYGLHNTLPPSYPPAAPPPPHHGYYQPAGPMIQSLSDSCLIHKPVAFHPFPGDRCQSHSQPGPPQQPHQPFPVESCHTHQTTPYPPTGPGPGGQKQVYAGGGGVGGRVSTASSSSTVGPAHIITVSSTSSSSVPPTNGPTSTTGRTSTTSAVVVGGGRGTATSASALDKCKSSSGGNLSRPPPPSTPEHYFTDGCQSCAAIAAAAAAAVAGCQQSDQYSSSAAAVQHYSRTSGGGSGAPPPPPPPPTPSSVVTQFLHAREHLQTAVNGGSATDPYSRLPPMKPDVGLQNAALPTQTKTVKVEANDSLVVISDLEVDDDGGGFITTSSTLLPSNPSIAAAAKTPKNGRHPHLHHNKSSPPSADVVSVANEQNTMMHHHLRPKEARLTVSLEDVFRNTSTDQWIATSLHHRLQALRVDEKQDSDRCRRTNGLRTRGSKALEITRKKYMIQTRSCNNNVRAKLGIRDVTNEKRSLLTKSTYEEQRKRNNGNSGGRFQSSLIPYRQSRLSSCSRGPFEARVVPVQYHASRSTETSKGPSTRRNHLLQLPVSTKSRNHNHSVVVVTEAVSNRQQQQMLRSKAVKKFPRYSNGWTWEGTPFRKAVYLHNDDPPVVRRCYPAMRHVQGDIIRVRDCILLKSGPRRVDLPFVAKVAALWENPDDGEMMVSLLWYYRPEHTDQGRKPHHMEDEIFASKHRDVNSVACIEDKCHVLTFNEYCRYHSKIRILEEGLRPSQSVVADPEDGYPRKERQPSGRLSTDLVFFCRKVYDFRQKRILKNPS